MSIQASDEEKAAAKAAAKVERLLEKAKREPVVIGPRSFEFGGHEYEVDPQTIPVEALEAIDDKRYVAAMREILGPEQWETYKARHPQASDLEEFLRAMFAAVGPEA